MKCPRCQQDHPPHAKFCLECGTPLRDVILTERPYTDLQAEIGGLQRELGEAREQQTATAEILRVISSSPTDIQAVLATVAERAARLCDSFDAAIFLVDGDTLRRVAHHGPVPPTGSTTPLVRGLVNGRVVLERREIHLADLQAETDEFPEGSAEAQRVGWRTTLAVPLMRENTVTGTIAIRRTEVRPFSMQQIDLLKTFADQAVIAIENVRLFNETKEALERQTATSEVLRAISRSQTDVQPVFDAIVRSAVDLCGADIGALNRVEGDRLHSASVMGASPEIVGAVRRLFPRPLDTTSRVGRAIIERRVIHVPDIDEPSALPGMREVDQALRIRSQLTVPMLREQVPIGSITVIRQQPGPFSDAEIELLKTFADQAIIAIENVRLFRELEAKNRELTDTLERQTATSEILRVISQSPTDIKPVFDTIIRSAVGLCNAARGTIYRFDGELIHVAAQAGYSEEQEALFLSFFPRLPDIQAPPGRAILERALVHIPSLDVAGPALAAMQQFSKAAQ